MKIFFIAPDYYGVDKSIRDAFVGLGFVVVLKNTRNKFNLIERASLKISNELPFTLDIATTCLKFYLTMENNEYLALIRKEKPDLVFILKGETVFPDTIKMIKDKLGVPLAALIWDCPFYSYAGKFADPFRRNNLAEGLHLYDYIFVYDPFYVEAIKKKGVFNVSYLPLATDPLQYKKMDLPEDEKAKYSFDVCFVGTVFPNRVEVLDELREFNLGVFGDGWEKHFKSRPLPSYYKGIASGERVSKIYSSSKIVLNIHDPEAKHGLNLRTFDILATGAFELVDYKPQLDSLFKVGEELIYYKDLADLKKLIRFYLNNPEERKRIANNGRAKLLSAHTWKHRISEAISVLRHNGILPGE